MTVKDSLGVDLENIRVDGHGAGTTVDEGGGAGIANFYGVFYRNASGTLEDVDIVAVRDPYPGGSTPGGQPNVDGVQRGIGVVVDNDGLLPFAMHGGSISDFQKQAGTFVRADLDVSGVTVTGGGAQPVIAQNGFSINRSTGSVTGNTMSDIGYAGPASAYSGVILASSNTDLIITGNALGGSNFDAAAAKVVGIWVYQNGPANSGGEISGNQITFTDVGIAVDDSITPDTLAIHDNAVSDGDLTDPYSAGVRFEPSPALLTTPFEVEGTAMHDKLSGAAGADVFEALGGADTLSGGAGDDILDGGTGADGMTGGIGDDSYYVDDTLDVVTEGIAAGTDEILTTLASFTLAPELENLTGLAGTGQELNGNAAVNFIRAGAGTDSLAGGDGADTLDGGAGADVMTGGYGSDTFYADHVDESLIEAGSGGDDDLAIASVSFRLAYGVNHLQLVGTAGTGLGNSLSNDISGNASANALKGLSGNDAIVGGAGADRIYGGPGNDLLQGDAGGDRFYFDASFTSSANVDEIADFSVADDSIFLSRSYFKTIATGPLSAAAFHTGASAHDRSDRILYDPATGSLFYDPDGTGATGQVLFATLQPALLVTHADFVVYG